MRKPFDVLEVDRVVVEGEDRDFVIDPNERTVTVRHDLTPAQMYDVGYAMALADRASKMVFIVPPPDADSL